MTPFSTAVSALPARSLLLALVPLFGHAQSQEMARVVSSTPVVTQVAAPQQICNQSQVITAAPKSGAGALIGAVAGGAIGSTIGGGSGRALATAVGVIGGAIAGDNLESAPPPIAQPATSCAQYVVYENRVTAYNVVYEYAGKQYSIQLPNDPGPYLPIRISPSVAAAPPVSPPPVAVSSPIVSAPIMVGPSYAPVYYGPPAFYGPPAVSFRWVYGGGGWGGRHPHRDWR